MAKVLSYLLAAILVFAVATRAQDYDYTGGAPLRMLANTTAPAPAPKAASNKTNATTTKKASAEVDGAESFATVGTSVLLVVLGANLVANNK